MDRVADRCDELVEGRGRRRRCRRANGGDQLSERAVGQRRSGAVQLIGPALVVDGRRGEVGAEQLDAPPVDHAVVVVRRHGDGPPVVVRYAEVHGSILP